MKITSSKKTSIISEIMILISIFTLGYLIKVQKIEKGDFVTWDEAHFGKFSSLYIKREFHFDVHPPLGKLLTTLSGILAKQDVLFDFESGFIYPKTLDYCTMRRFHALIGSFIPLLAFLTMREMGNNPLWSSMFSMFFVFENGMVMISRLIVLDSHLLLFTFGVIYFLIRYLKRKNTSKYSSLFFLGISLGLELSIKWFGCFTTIFEYFLIIHELYDALKFKKFSDFIKMFISRAVVLILLPLAIYAFFFYLHFKILLKSTSEEASMSSLFQIGLRKEKNFKIGKFVISVQ